MFLSIFDSQRKVNTSVLAFFNILISCLVIALIIVINQPRPKPTLIKGNTSVATNLNNVPAENKKLEFGVYSDSPNIDSINKKLNYKLNIVAWYVHWNGTFKSNKLTNACKQDYLPVVTWESWNGQSQSGSYSLADIASGKYDSYIKNQLNIFNTTCPNQKVILRFDHEMDTPVGVVGWYPWQGDPQDYINAWIHIVKLSHSIDPNILWLWSPNRGTSLTANYYPGNEWVNYVGLSLNRGTLPQEEKYNTWEEFYGANQTVIESFKKPIIISETADDELLGGKAGWVSGMFTYAESNKNITALIWFNDSSGYRFDSSPQSLQAFKQSLSKL